MSDAVHPIDRRTTSYRPWPLYVTTGVVALCAAGLLIGGVILPLGAAPGGDLLDPLAAICRSLGITITAEPAGEGDTAVKATVDPKTADADTKDVKVNITVGKKVKPKSEITVTVTGKGGSVSKTAAIKVTAEKGKPADDGEE